MVLNKTCSKCKQELPLELFSCTKRNLDGSCKYYGSWCNSCRTNSNRNRLGSVEKVKPIVTETHKECLKCHTLKLFSEFSPAERGRLGLSSYCKNCSFRASKESHMQYTKKYRHTNRERYLAQHRVNMFNRRNILKAQTDGTVDDDFLKFLYAQEYCCWCSQYVEKIMRTLEHIVELSNGGLHSITNITMACFSCNSKRLNRNGDNPCDSLFSKYTER